ncbi:MAG: hemerythrin domain-containing protein [Betaproteobacteria bacterium]
MRTSCIDPRALLRRWTFDGFEALDSCHRETLRMLAQLDALLRRLDETGADAAARAMAAEIERHFSVTQRAHHEDEERHVFPALEAAGDAATRHAIECLRQDHFWLATDWAELSPLVDAIACGQSCCDVEALRQGAEVFGQLCRDHIALEESLIYPQARANMAADVRAAMDSEMAARRRRAPPQLAAR